MLEFFIFRIEWKKNKIMLESNAPGYPVTFERKWLNGFQLWARGFEN